MSFSPKHTTSFSVTDILSAAAATGVGHLGDDALKKTSIEASIPPLFPTAHYPRSSSASAASAGSAAANMTSMAAAAAAASMNGSMAAANAYNYQLGQLSAHHTSSFPSQYCNGTDLTGYGDPMQGIRNSTSSWYTGNADPRIASKYIFYTIYFQCT